MENGELFIEKAGFSAWIVQDMNPESPRSWDNLGKMVCFHPHYELGDKTDFKSDQSFIEFWQELGYKSTREYLEKELKAVVKLPLFLYDHSGLSMSTRREYPFNDIWDAGQVGFIYATKKGILDAFSKKRLTKSLLLKAEACLVGEVETYGQFLQGNVWGVIIENSEGAIVDSCYGFFGIEVAKNDAEVMLDSAIRLKEMDLTKRGKFYYCDKCDLAHRFSSVIETWQIERVAFEVSISWVYSNHTPPKKVIT